MFNELFGVAALAVIILAVILIVDFFVEGWLLLRPPSRFTRILLNLTSATVAGMFVLGMLALVEQIQ